VLMHSSGSTMAARSSLSARRRASASERDSMLSRMNARTGGVSPSMGPLDATRKPVFGICACGPRKTRIDLGAWVVSGGSRAPGRIYCTVCVPDKKRAVFIGSVVSNILGAGATLCRPFLPGNVSYIEKSTPWEDFRSSVLAAADLHLSLKTDKEPFRSVGDFFERIGSHPDDIGMGMTYEFSSEVEKTVVLYDNDQRFAGKFTFCISSGHDGKLIFQPLIWLPPSCTTHVFEIRIDPGAYKFPFVLHPLHFKSELRVDQKFCPKTPRGFFMHTLSFSLSPGTTHDDDGIQK